jgi:cytochrome c oxidase accessory protein FixG
MHAMSLADLVKQAEVPEPGASNDAAAQTVAPGVERTEVDAVNKKENRPLYAKRVPIYPKRAQGRFRSLKWLIMALTLGIYYITPWLRWDRGATMPDQAVLVDLANGRLYFFFIEIWPQEIYYLTGLLILASFLLFLMTTLAGRVWCGYSCPQTVWTDLFIVIERFFEGDRAARIRLAKERMSSGKALKKLGKHTTWVLVAMLTGGAWVFYFADAPTLALDLVTLDAPSIAYLTIAILTATTYVFGGHMREQVCTYMCPWPRIQAALQDEDSLIVSYKDDRGEPRGAHKKGEPWDGRGDCVDCLQCVAVCPMGIDIRDGQQLECISCALCIDACDAVMAKIGRPRGLVDYDTLRNHDLRQRGQPERRIRLIRPRTVIYTALVLLVAGIMTVMLATRSDLEVNLLHDRNPLFVQLSDGSIRNGFTLKILNKAQFDAAFSISVEGLPNARLSVIGHAEDYADGTGVGLPVSSDTVGAFKLFVAAPAADLEDAKTPIAFTITDTDSARDRTMRIESVFRGPER